MAPNHRRDRRKVRWAAKSIHMIREAVGEVEAAWAQELGSERFAQLRGLLLDLNRMA